MDKKKIPDELPPLTAADLSFSGMLLPPHMPRRFPADAPEPLTHHFRRLDEGRYRLSLLGWPTGDISLDVDRLRREHHELVGELTASCDIPGAKTTNGVLFTASFNFSSAQARQTRAKIFAERARTGETFDWLGFLERFAQCVNQAERTGQPAITLRDLPASTTAERAQVIEGLPILIDHPMILFGDGGAMKSYLALFYAGTLCQRGIHTLYADWELNEHDQRARLEEWFGSSMPAMEYIRCEAPLVEKIDHLFGIVRDRKIQYIVVDSLSYSLHGKAEDSDIAQRYMAVFRRLKIGGLLLAHVNRSETGDKKPFGSVFWANGPRATWFIQREDDSSDEHQTTVTLFNRKANIHRLADPIGYSVAFQCAPRRLVLSRVNPADAPGAVEKLSLGQRLSSALTHGRRTVQDLAEVTAIKPEIIRTTVKRQPHRFDYDEVNGVYYIGLASRKDRDGEQRPHSAPAPDLPPWAS